MLRVCRAIFVGTQAWNVNYLCDEGLLLFLGRVFLRCTPFVVASLAPTIFSLQRPFLVVAVLARKERKKEGNKRRKNSCPLRSWRFPTWRSTDKNKRARDATCVHWSLYLHIVGALSFLLHLPCTTKTNRGACVYARHWAVKVVILEHTFLVFLARCV